MLSKITYDNCLRFRDYLQKELKIKHSTAIVTFSYFKKILQYATNYKRILPTDPSLQIDFEKITNKERYSVLQLSVDKRVYIEDNDLKNILNKFDSVPKYSIRDYEKILITKTMLNTGLRIGEVLSLTWDNISIETNTIQVRKNIILVRGEYIIQAPKTKSSIRDVSISNSFMNELIEYKTLLEDFKTNRFVWHNDCGDLVFPSLDKIKGGLQMKLNTYSKWLKLFFIDEPNLNYLRPHIFRHTHASLLIQAGANVIDVAKRLGHSNSKITEAIYIHLTKKQDMSLANKIESVLK